MIKLKTFTSDITLTFKKWKPRLYCKADQYEIIPIKGRIQ